jgi:hypothetical protein
VLRNYENKVFEYPEPGGGRAAAELVQAGSLEWSRASRW